MRNSGSGWILNSIADRGHLAGLLQFLKRRQIGFRPAERGGIQIQQLFLFQAFDQVAGVRLLGHLAQLGARAPRAVILVEHFGFAGVFVMGAGALVDGVAQPRLEADQAQHARRIVVERIVVNGAQFLALDVADAVGGIDQQSQRGLVERERDGVDGEVAAAQIFVNGRGA